MLKKKRLKIGTLAVVLFALAGGTALAATFQVTQLTDDNGPCDADCSIREAILAANALPGLDLIWVPAGTHVLTIPGPEVGIDALLGDLDVTETVEIRGAGAAATIVQSLVNDRVISVFTSAGSPREILLADLGITGGVAALGGGVSATTADITLERVEIFGNSASIFGGGLYTSASNLNLVESTVSGNTVPDGSVGGIYLICPTSSCSANITRSTISGNSASGGVGAIYNSGAVLTIVDSTITDNHALHSTGIRNSNGAERIRFERSIIDGSCSAMFFVTSGGGNLESPGDTCLLTDPTDLVDLAEIGLGPLADNGGPTRTHLPRPGSPAIDAAGLNCDAFDQRGFPRPEDGDFDGIAHCDSGAVEAYSRGLAIDVPSLGLPGGVLLAALLALAGFGVLRRVGG